MKLILICIFDIMFLRHEATSLMKKSKAEKPGFKVNQMLEYWTKLKKAADWAEAVSGTGP